MRWKVCSSLLMKPATEIFIVMGMYTFDTDLEAVARELYKQYDYKMELFLTH